MLGFVMAKRIFLAFGVLLLVGIVGIAALAYRPAIATVPVPAFAPALVAEGEILAAGGYCATCHTVRGGAPFAGGRAMKTGFGTLYSTNITPDPETGIGGWSQAAFARALREGISRDGSQLFPALPFDHFTKLSDDDVAALYAYMMSRPAVKAPAKPNDLPFPLNIRALQAGWKLLFFKAGRFTADPAHNAQWNRGAYLTDALGHCGACHTPRNALGAEQPGKPYAGASIDGWIAPALTAANQAPIAWTTPELTAYLTTGVSLYHGTAAGPMSAVVHDGLAKLPPADQQAVTLYIESLGQGDSRAGAAAPVLAKALAVQPGKDADGRLFTAACGSCHHAGAAPNPLRPLIALNSAVTLDEPTNLIRLILYGIGAKQGAPGVVMPGLGGLSDADVARLAAVIRRTHSALPPWNDLAKKVAAVRADGPGES